MEGKSSLSFGRRRAAVAEAGADDDVAATDVAAGEEVDDGDDDAAGEMGDGGDCFRCSSSSACEPGENLRAGGEAGDASAAEEDAAGSPVPKRTTGTAVSSGDSVGVWDLGWSGR